MTDFLDDLFRIRGLKTVVIADSAAPTVVSAASAKAFVIEATGTVTAPRAMVLPHKAGAAWVVYNGTAYALTVKGPSGSGTSLEPGERVLVYSTGSNFERSGGAGAGAPSVQAYTVTADATLSHGYADADLLVLGGASPHVTTFPLSVRDGAPIVVWNQSGATQTIADQDGSTYDVVAGAVITLQRAGSQLVLTSLAPFGSNLQVLLGTGRPGNVPAAALPSSVVQAGAAPAIDASHLHVYACGETSGTTLADTGSGTQVAATLLGSAGVAYALGSPRPFARGTKGLRLLADTLAHGAQVTVAGMGIGAYTIECFGLIDEYVASSPTVDMMVTVDDGSGNNAIHFGIISTGLVFGGTVIGGSDRNTTTSYSQAAQPVQLGVPAHWMAVYDPVSTPTFKLFRNGTLVADNGQQSGSMPSLSRITIGNRGALDAGARGAIVQVRVSPMARSAAYALAAAETLFAL